MPVLPAGRRRNRVLVRLSPGLVHPLLELLADLEERQPLGLHLDRVASARVAPLVRLVVSDLEAAEAPDLDALALLQRLLHRVEDAVDDQLRLALGQVQLVGDHLDQIRLGHTTLLATGPRHWGAVLCKPVDAPDSSE